MRYLVKTVNLIYYLLKILAIFNLTYAIKLKDTFNVSMKFYIYALRRYFYSSLTCPLNFILNSSFWNIPRNINQFFNSYAKQCMQFPF